MAALLGVYLRTAGQSEAVAFFQSEGIREELQHLTILEIAPDKGRPIQF